jgi:RNA polymerase-associated protein CTR9
MVSPGVLEEEPVSLTMGKSERSGDAIFGLANTAVILNLARGQPKEAHVAVDRLLQRQPRNIIALSAQVSFRWRTFRKADIQARLQFARRLYDDALHTYQTLLNVQPDMKPDPRIGLGLCAWVMGDRGRAVLSWERALELVSRSLCMSKLG